MSTLAPTLQAFFTDRLIKQRNASPNTIAAYRDTMRLLLAFAQQTLSSEPSSMDIAELDAPLISAFLDHLEHDRGNSIRTRNARLAAIRTLYRFATLRHPEHAATIQRVLAIPPKCFAQATVAYLTDTEINALLQAPDLTTWTGRRDRALLLTAIQTGLRVSELIGLTTTDAHLATGPHVSCHGKGRKTRVTPLTRETAHVLRVWLDERQGGPADPLFPTRPGRPMSRDAIEHRLVKHVTTAANRCPTLHTKHVTPHALRHTAAMRLLHAGVDTAVIAPLARTRIPQHHTDLPARRPRPEGTRHRANDPTKHTRRPIPTTRQAPRLP